MHVLVVEDDVRLAEALARILEDNGYIVDTVHDGQAGIDYGRSGTYDVIILGCDVVCAPLTAGDLTLNLESLDLTCGAETIRLSQKEFAIARILLGSPGAVVSKEALIARAWGPDSNASENNVEAYISFLRKKIGHVGSTARIETIRSVGYRLAESAGR